MGRPLRKLRQSNESRWAHLVHSEAVWVPFEAEQCFNFGPHREGAVQVWSGICRAILPHAAGFDPLARTRNVHAFSRHLRAKDRCRRCAVYYCREMWELVCVLRKGHRVLNQEEKRRAPAGSPSRCRTVSWFALCDLTPEGFRATCGEAASPLLPDESP